MNIKNTDSGFALVAVMIFAALGGVLGTALLYGVGSQIKSAAREIRSEKAFFIAEAGVELAKAELRSSGANSFNSNAVIFGGGQVSYRTTTNTLPNVIILSTGTYENVSRVLEVTVRVGDPDDLPPPNTDGAVGVYGTNTHISASGNALIDGQDYSLPANFDCNGASCAGTLTTNPAMPGVFSTTTDTVVTTSGSGSVVGNPPTTNGASLFSTNYWQDLADAWISQAAITLSGTYSADTDLGTRDNPKITIVTGNTTITSNLDGAGILIVMDGINLTTSGNFHYEGIIILTGNNNFGATGTVRLFGALVSIGNIGNITTAQGTPSIQYSSQALANLRNMQLSARMLSVVYWREIK